MDVPDLYRSWAGLAIVAGALRRNTWARTKRGRIFPNLFVALVANPGIGKSLIISQIRDFWTAAGEQLPVAPSTITRAALMEFLREQTIGQDNENLQAVHIGLFAASELGNLLPAHDLAWLNTLNDLYDCPPTIEERTVKRGAISISNPYIHIVGGTQPKYLSSILPEEAYGMGFVSRLLMVYAGDNPSPGDIFHGPKLDMTLRVKLDQDLKKIMKLKGEFQFKKAAMDMLNEWNAAGQEPKPTHPRLQSYTQRRLLSIIKMSMSFSASDRGDMLITPNDIQRSFDLLHPTEAIMPQIFMEMERGTFGQVIEETLAYIWQQYMLKKSPIPEPRIVNYLINKVPQNQVMYTIQLMVNSSKIRRVDSVVDGITYANKNSYVPLEIDPGADQY